MITWTCKLILFLTTSSHLFENLMLCNFCCWCMLVAPTHGTTVSCWVLYVKGKHHLNSLIVCISDSDCSGAFVLLICSLSVLKYWFFTIEQAKKTKRIRARTVQLPSTSHNSYRAVYILCAYDAGLLFIHVLLPTREMKNIYQNKLKFFWNVFLHAHNLLIE